ncbi:hypothetical protein [Streptomyces sp. NPDC003077]|uniref:hypothetical protein n=1 Tax=Streptomyces sp. NPDC003077 TaxID=3154443 RepID=UPI0033B82C67
MRLGKPLAVGIAEETEVESVAGQPEDARAVVDSPSAPRDGVQGPAAAETPRDQVPAGR